MTPREKNIYKKSFTPTKFLLKFAVEIFFVTYNYKGFNLKEVKEMRFQVTYQVKGTIPLQYRYKVYGLIKEAIKQVAPDYYERLFVQERHEIKPFSFAVFLRNFDIQGDRIHLDDLTITISSPNLEFCVNAINGLRKLKSYKVEDAEWQQTSIRMLKEAVIGSNMVVLRTMSPMLVEDKQGKPVGPHDEGFNEELNYYADLLVQRVAGRSLIRPVQFTPYRMSRVVIKEINRDFARTQPNQSLYYTTYKGVFCLSGHREDLQLLYQTGIGKRTVFFGLTEYVREGV